MAATPIQIQLTKFEQIEILRAEIDLREQELKRTEKQIRDTLFEVERQKYLQTVHPIFTQLPAPAGLAQLSQFSDNRDALMQALETMQAALTALEAETIGQTAPPSRGLGKPSPAGAAGAARRPKFDSFDDFRASKSNG